MTDVKRKEKYESDIQREICDWLEKRGLFFWRSNNVPVFAKNNAGKMVYRSLPKHTPKGIPDIMIVMEGKLVGLEVKRPGAALRPEQRSFGDRLIENGGGYYIVTSIEDTLNAIAYERKT